MDTHDTERARAALGSAFRLIESQEVCDDQTEDLKTETLRRLSVWLMTLAPKDARRTCGRCGRAFIWPQTPGEQQYYASRAFPPPTHCWECRVARRAERVGRRTTSQGSHDIG